MRVKFYEEIKNVNQQRGFTLRMNYGYKDKFQLHNHNYCEFFLAVSGNVIHIVNGKKQFLPERSLVFVRPSDTHTYTRGGDFSFVNLAFKMDTMVKLCQYLGNSTDEIFSSKMPPVVLLDEHTFKKTMHRLNALNAIDINDDKQMELKMKIILTEIISYIIENTKFDTNSDTPLWLLELVAKLKRIDNINTTIDEMVEFTNKSREHISRSFKKYFNITVSEFINEQRLNYSANLLMNTNLPVIDICFQSGFQNLSWFYRKFREKYGLSPLDFRRNANT